MNTRIRVVRTLASAALVCIGIAAIAQGYVPGRVLVKFREGVSVSDAHRALLNMGGTTQRALRGLSTKVVAVPVGREAFIAARLRASDIVEYAEVDGYATPAQVTPDDPWYQGGTPTGVQWPLIKIGCPIAWSITTGSASVTLAIIDTGVDETHEDLHDKITPGYNVASNNSNTMDTEGHGTIVAGTSAAHADNTLGVASVAWGVRIMPIRITESNGSAPFSNFAEALSYAKSHGAKVANISWAPMWASSTILDAAHSFRQNGGLVVVAAGNNGYQYGYSDFPDLLVVGASDGNDNYTTYSNYGNLIDVVAPGSTYSTKLGGNAYTSGWGTSVATPYVSAAAALLWSYDPNLTPTQVENLIESSSVDLGPTGFDIHFGWGRLDVSAALIAAGGTPGGGGGGDLTPPVVDILSPSSGAALAGSVAVSAEASDNVGVVEVRLMIDGNVVATDSTAPYLMDWDTAGWANGSHSLRVRALDAAGNYADDVINVTVQNYVPDTIAPTVTITSPAPGQTIGGRTYVTVDVWDNVGVVRCELYVNGRRVASSTTAPFTMLIRSGRMGGALVLTVKAYDAAGNIGISPPVTVYR